MDRRTAAVVKAMLALFVKRAAIFVPALVASIATMAGAPGSAVASPGALKVLILEAQCQPTVPPQTLRAEILAQPGVASVDFFDGNLATPTDVQLAPYDVVLAMNDCVWSDPVATGERLADYEDQGGVVVGAPFDWSGTFGYPLEGRWITAGYTPFEVGAGFEPTTATLGTHLAGDPLLSGVSSLSADQREDVTVAAGAREIAEWSDGIPAVAVKGDAVGVNAYLGDEGGAHFSGDFARLIVNAGNVLGRHELSVTKAGGGQGTVTSAPAGIECGAACSAAFGNGTTVRLSAGPTAGSSFAGWSGAGCGGGSTCTVTMSAAENVTATFEVPPGPPSGPPASPAAPSVSTPVSRCVVPSLTGRKLKLAKKKIRFAHCRLGLVSRSHGVSAKTGRVVRQVPKAGKVSPAGTKVSVKLAAGGPTPQRTRRPGQ